MTFDEFKKKYNIGHRSEKRMIDADELLNRIDKVAKKPSLSIDTVNGLCGAVAIIYDMLIETGQEKGEE